MAPLPLYPCRGLNEGVVLYDNEALKKLANVDISMTNVQSRWYGWGRGKFHLLKEKSHTKLEPTLHQQGLFVRRSR